MTSDLPTDPRQALEASLTALLLGELPPDQAAFLERVLAADPELARMHERLKQTVSLVRETESERAKQAGNQTAALKLSDERRQALLQQFKTIAPKEFEGPRRRRVTVLAVCAAAAVVVLLVSLAMPNLGSKTGHPLAFSSAPRPQAGQAAREAVSRALRLGKPAEPNAVELKTIAADGFSAKLVDGGSKSVLGTGTGPLARSGNRVLGTIVLPSGSAVESFAGAPRRSPDSTITLSDNYLRNGVIAMESPAASPAPSAATTLAPPPDPSSFTGLPQPSSAAPLLGKDKVADAARDALPDQLLNSGDTSVAFAGDKSAALRSPGSDGRYSGMNAAVRGFYDERIGPDLAGTPAEKVPNLGDVPTIGGLFRTEAADSNAKKEAPASNFFQEIGAIPTKENGMAGGREGLALPPGAQLPGKATRGEENSSNVYSLGVVGYVNVEPGTRNYTNSGMLTALPDQIWTGANADRGPGLAEPNHRPAGQLLFLVRWSRNRTLGEICRRVWGNPPTIQALNLAVSGNPENTFKQRGIWMRRLELGSNSTWDWPAKRPIWAC
jgi:hypothetical protein